MFNCQQATANAKRAQKAANSRQTAAKQNL